MYIRKGEPKLFYMYTKGANFDTRQPRSTVQRIFSLDSRATSVAAVAYPSWTDEFTH